MEKNEVKAIIEKNAVIPVVTIDAAEKAVPLAEAMIKGGVTIAEIAFRTSCALEAIQEIREKCPAMCAGAGTVKTVDQCQTAIEGGAKFVVSPGFSPGIAEYCRERNVLYIPGCATSTEIMWAMEYGIDIIKFFPSNFCGGIAAIRALAGPFPEIRFVPTCGITADNVADFVKEPSVLAAGGSWLCPKGAIEAGDFDRITSLCRMTRNIVLGYEVHHMGINCHEEKEAKVFCLQMQKMFGLAYKPGNSSDFSSDKIEVKKYGGPGEKGHIAIGTNSIISAIADLTERGFAVDESTKVFKSGRLIAVYLKDEVGGYAVHLSQK